MTNPWDQRLGVWSIAREHPNTLAVLDSPEGTRTYAELTGGAHQLVHLFRSYGLRRGDVVAAMLGNGVPIVEVSLACSEAGLYYIPLNTHLTPRELDVIMDHSGCAVLIVGHEFESVASNVRESSPHLHVLVSGSPEDPQSLELARAAFPTTEPEDRSPGALFVYTSGTTGKPKGIKRGMDVGNPDDAAAAAAIFSRAFDFTPFDGPMLVSTGMFHGGSQAFYIGGLNAGHALVIMSRFDAEQSLALIEKHKVRTGYMVPTQFSRLLGLPEDVKAKYDVSSLHAIVHSAAPCPRTVKQQMFDWWGPVIWETYGGMEGAATIAKPHHWLKKPGTVGRAIRGVVLSILDDDGNELGPNEVGNIYLTNDVGFEYHNDADGTQQAYKGKRFSIGDVGYIDDDGFLFISDRAKDMIITGGTNVYPAEIEAVLHTHPAVHDVAVIGIPDDDWGESVKAVVQLRPGVEPSDELAGELIAFCKAELASYKCPRSVEFREELPRTEAGKLYKRKIRDEIVASATAKETSK